MAAFTTTQAGNWSAGATWVGGVAPNLAGGDTATIAHAVDVDVNAVIDGLTINAALSVLGGATFKPRGAVVQGNAICDLKAGGTLELDTSLGSFAWTLATGNSQANCIFRASGTSGNHCTVTVTGGNRFHILVDTNFFHSGSYDCTYCDFEGVRNAAGTIGFQIASFGQTAFLKFLNCTFDDCAEIDSLYDFDTANGQVFRIEDCIWSNTPSGLFCLDIRTNSASGTLPTVLRCGFDAIVKTSKAIGVAWQGNVFDKGATMEGSMSGGVWERNFYRNIDNDNVPSGGIAWTDCYMVSDDATGNPHWLGPANNRTYDGIIFDYPHDLTFDTGDGFLNTNATSIVFRNCLMLPGPDGHTGGFLCNIGSTSGTDRNCKALHNTVCGKFAMVVYLKDPGYIQAGEVWDEIKSNLCYSPETGEFKDASIVYDLDVATSPYDLAVGSGCTHNGIYNGIAYTDPDNGNANYVGYKHRFPTSGTPGSNDVVADPQFFAYGRNLIQWAVYKGVAVSGDTNATKVANARALLRSNPSLVYDDLIPWVREGYAPTNPAYQDAGHDGVTIGAVEFEEQSSVSISFSSNSSSSLSSSSSSLSSSSPSSLSSSSSTSTLSSLSTLSSSSTSTLSSQSSSSTSSLSSESTLSTQSSSSTSTASSESSSSTSSISSDSSSTSSLSSSSTSSLSTSSSSQSGEESSSTASSSSSSSPVPRTIRVRKKRYWRIGPRPRP